MLRYLLAFVCATLALPAAPLATSPFAAALAHPPATAAADTQDPAAGNRVLVIGGYDALLLRIHLIPTRELRDVDAALKKDTFKRYPTRAYYDFGPHFDALDREAGVFPGTEGLLS